MDKKKELNLHIRIPEGTLTLRHERIWYALLLLPFCLPEIFYFNSLTSLALQAWKALVILWAGVLFAWDFFTYEAQEWLLFAFFGAVFLSSLLQGEIPSTSLMVFAVYLLFLHYMKEDAAGFLSVFVLIIEALALINLASVLIWPDGMYATADESYDIGYTANWFLGYKNPMIRLLLPGCAAAFLYAEEFDKGKRGRAVFLTAITTVTMVLVGSSAGLLGCGIFIAFAVIAAKKPEILAGWSLLKSFLVSAALAVMIVVFRMQEVFAFVIEKLLSRDVSSLTGRTTIWDTAMEIIAQSPALGYGEAVSAVMKQHIYASHPHNYLLYVLMQGGTIGLLLLALFIAAKSRSLKPAFSEHAACAVIIIGALTAFWVMGTAESLTSTYFLYPLFTFAESFAKEKEKTLEKDRNYNGLSHRQLRHKAAGIRHTEDRGRLRA